MQGRFFAYNEKLCSRLDKIFTENRENDYLEAFLSEMQSHHLVADVGGGKKPARCKYPLPSSGVSAYDGLDIDDTELQLAPAGTYTETFCVDITGVPESLFERYDRIVCRNTLEHVGNMDRAIQGLSSMLKPNGQLYIKTTCRFAAYAIINRILPEDAKRKILFYIFPNKSTDGFPAHYDRCSIGEITDLAGKCGLKVTTPPNRMYYSSYFSFFLPIYVAWRAVSSIQILTNREYCERFEIILQKAG